MPFCAVKLCGRNSKTSDLETDGITFYRFPKCPELNEKWRVTAQQGADWVPRQHNTICSRHFKEDCFKTENKQRELLESAVPTLHLTQPSKESTSAAKSLIDTSEKCLKSESSTKKQAKSVSTKKKGESQSNEIPDIKDIVKILLQKELLPYEAAEFLEYVEFDASELQASDAEEEISEELRAFAITLHFYSQKAYDFVRDTYNTRLPPPNRLFKWYLTKDGRPGFTQEAAEAIAQKAFESSHQIDATIMFDYIQIEPDISYDSEEKRMYGSVNYGFSAEFETDNDEAKESLFFLLVPLNATWKIPIGYFLCSSCDSQQRAALIMQAIHLVEDTGINVKAVTLRGYNGLNLTDLGYSLNPIQTKTTFKNPSSGADVAVFLDLNRMMTLLQFSWMSHGEYFNETGSFAAWKHLVKLQMLLGKPHLKKWKEKACSSLVIDKSLTEYLALCQQKKLSEFKEVTGTIGFLRILNILQDIFDSVIHGDGLKKAVTKENYQQVLKQLEATKKLLKSMTGFKDGGKITVIHSKHNIGIVGLYLTIVSAEKLIRDQMQNPETVLPLHRANPVHLQHFLGMIMHHKTSRGFISAKEVEETYKKLLTDIPIRNFEKSPPVSAIILCPSAVDRINITSRNFDPTEDFKKRVKRTDQFIKIEKDLRQAIYAENTIDFMSQYIVKTLIKELKCENCVEALVKVSNNPKSLVQRETDDSKKVVPSDTVKQICVRCEKYINTAVNEHGSKNLDQKQDFYVSRVLESLIGCDLFPELNAHQFDVEFPNHVVDLTICVIKTHIDARFWLIAKGDSGLQAKWE